MPHLNIYNVVQDDRPGFYSIRLLSGEIVAHDRDGFKAVVQGPGIFEVFVEGELKKSQTVGSEKVDISLNDILPVNARPKVGTAVTFSVRQEGEPAEAQTHVGVCYRFVQSEEDMMAFERALQHALDNRRRQEAAQREGLSRLIQCASDSLNAQSGLLDASTQVKSVLKALSGRRYSCLAGELSGNGEFSINTAKEAFDILFEGLAKGVLFTLPNPTWFHRVVMEAARRQNEPLPLKLESVEAYLQELRDSAAGRLIATKISQSGMVPFTSKELVLLTRSGAIVQDPPTDKGLGRLRINRAFMPRGHESDLNYMLRLHPYDK